MASLHNLTRTIGSSSPAMTTLHRHDNCSLFNSDLSVSAPAFHRSLAVAKSASTISNGTSCPALPCPLLHMYSKIVLAGVSPPNRLPWDGDWLDRALSQLLPDKPRGTACCCGCFRPLNNGVTHLRNAPCTHAAGPSVDPGPL